jgi:hypothetical protein
MFTLQRERLLRRLKDTHVTRTSIIVVVRAGSGHKDTTVSGYVHNTAPSIKVGDAKDIIANLNPVVISKGKDTYHTTRVESGADPTKIGANHQSGAIGGELDGISLIGSQFD